MTGKKISQTGSVETDTATECARKEASSKLTRKRESGKKRESLDN